MLHVRKKKSWLILLVFIFAETECSCFAAPGDLVCDVELDGDCDNYDGMMILNEFGGTDTFADLDGSGTVGNGDFEILALNFGATDAGGSLGNFGSYTPGSATLTYNSVSGNVTLDQSGAPGSVINGFLLATPADEFTWPNENDLHRGVQFPFSTDVAPAIPGPEIDRGPTEISQTSTILTGFPSNPHDLGPILPTGLSLAEVQSIFAPNGTFGAYYVGDIQDANIGSRIHTFQLEVVAFSPSTNWTADAGNGLFGTGGNWSHGVPDLVTSRAVFNRGEVETVQVDIEAEFDSLAIESGQVAFEQACPTCEISLTSGIFLRGGARFAAGLPVTATANIEIASGGMLEVADSSSVATSRLIVGGTVSGSEGTGLLQVLPGGNVSAPTETVVYSGSTVTLDGGTLETAMFTRDAGGTFNFDSGRLRLIDDGSGNRVLDSSQLDQIFSGGSELGSGRTLEIAGPVSLESALRLAGGTFAVESVDAGTTTSFAENLDWDAGTLAITASDLVIGVGGLFGPQLILDANQALAVTQQVIIVEESAPDPPGQLVSAGPLETGGLINGGDLVLIDTTVSGPVTNSGAMTIVGNVVFNDVVDGAGEFFGPGTLEFVGGLSPGASPAEVGFEGNVEFAVDNTLLIELGGTTAGDEFDRLNIAGTALLDGALEVVLLDEFSPQLADSFEIIAAQAGIEGTFATLAEDLPALDDNLLWEISYAANNVVLSVVADSVPGDFDGDGFVDGADFLFWQRQTPSDSQALADWQANFGSGIGQQSGLRAVPEPHGLGLACLTFLVLILARPWSSRPFHVFAEESL